MDITDRIYKFLYESDESKEYQEFFKKKLAAYGVKSPSELSDEEKKKFFAEIEKEWTKEKE